MMFGREPRGPLALLKETWLGERDLPNGIGMTAAQYLTQLKNRLKAAAEKAIEYGGFQQQMYAKYRNRKAKEKTFEIGDEVIVLTPDSTNKIYARWIGPCTVLKKITNHSYLVETAEGRKIQLHANKMRHYERRVAVLGVIHESDEEFGEVQFAPTDSFTTLERLPSSKVSDLDLRHLDHEDTSALLRVIDKFDMVFSEKPGRCE